MEIAHFFSTPIWTEYRPEFLNSLNIASDKYIEEAKLKNKEHIQKYGDFGKNHHSTPLTLDNDFLDFRNYVGQQSLNFLDQQGFDMWQYETKFTELWVQEFSEKGGGHHSAHVHWNQHVSGFYFLKCSKETSYPIFHEPKTGARATKLKIKPSKENFVWPASDMISLKPVPGTIVIFPGYLEHEFPVDYGKEPFRFIHWNIQAFPKGVLNNVI